MSGLVEALRAAVVTHRLDLSELDEAYRDSGGEPLSLFYRVNWTRGQKKRRWELTVELDDFRKQMERGETPGVAARRQNCQAWLAWWQTILMVADSSPWHKFWGKLLGRDGESVPRRLTAKEIIALTESAAWEWVTATIIRRVGEYEAETTKKALGGPSVISEEPRPSPQNSNSE